MDEDDALDVSSIMPQLKGAKGLKKKSGGFQSMGLSPPILRAVFKKGYKVPTPIQRKAIPAIMQRKNVIGMARTGSGKTAAFVVPMLEKLKCRVPKAGARALIFSPTRELATQTMKFTKELSCFTNLKATLVLGGEKIEDQFAAIHECPDIIIATPGRFLHVVVEMDLKLSSVEYVVFDEADRLFEMGFQEQLKEVLNRLPSERQTLLFSATLPKVLVEFAKAGVEDPVLIRLDVDLQISENLKTSYLLCRSDDKPAILLYLLKNVIDTTKELTVVFLATKHHVEYMKDVLERSCIPCSCIYSSLDQTARNINIGKFRVKKVCVLLVTDIAARGIDIPLLDNVINFNFPAQPKLYVHRVGRVARAGRSGTAYSLVAPDETPYLLDLHLFLGKPIKFAKASRKDEDDVCGSVPQAVIDDEAELIQSWHNLFIDLRSMLKVTHNAYKKFVKSRPSPSNESVMRMKEMTFENVPFHPLFKDNTEVERSTFLSNIKNYRPNTTIFELGHLAKTHSGIMREKRKRHDPLVRRKTLTDNLHADEESETKKSVLESASENDLQSLIENDGEKKPKSRKIANYKDPEHYLSYLSKEHYKEKGLGIENSFERQAAEAVLDFTGDDDDLSRKLKNVTRWDRKKKKFVRNDDEMSKKIRTESGVLIPKSYKSNIYKKWQEQNKVKYREESGDEEESSQFGKQKGFQNRFKGKKRGRLNDANPKPMRREMKTKEQILKARNKKEMLLSHVKKKHMLKAKKSGKRR